MTETKCAVLAQSGRPCPRKAGAYTINGTCPMHHRAVRRISAANSPSGYTGYLYKDGRPFRDTWGSPLA